MANNEEIQGYLRTVRRTTMKSKYPIYPNINSTLKGGQVYNTKTLSVWSYVEVDGFLAKIEFSSTFDMCIEDSKDVLTKLTEKLHIGVKKTVKFYKPTGKVFDLHNRSIDIKIIEDESDTSKSKMEYRS